MVHAKLAFALLAVALMQAPAAEPGVEEYRVKGAFLLNFARFVEWPPETFKGPGDAIAVCIVGANPFSQAIDQAAKQMVVDNRPLTVRQIQDPQQARSCQIAFVSAAERKRVRPLLEAVQGGSVLTVGESEGFIASGGIVEFRVEDSKVKMDISAPAAKRAGLHISAKLLSLAQADKK